MPHSTSQCLIVPHVSLQSVEQFVLDFEAWWETIKKTPQMTSTDDLHVVDVLNWAAPSSIPAKTQEHHGGVMGHSLNGMSSNAMGICIAPVFGYKRGQLWRTQMASFQMLANKNVDVDWEISLAYDGRHDSRDGRPLHYPVRLLRGMARKDCGAWKNSRLFQVGAVNAGEQTATKYMILEEDMDDASLPGNGVVTQVEKHQQLGDNACMRLLQTCLDGMTVGPRESICVIDVHARHGDFARAFLRLLHANKMPLFYFGLAHTDVCHDWLTTTIRDHARDLVLDGRLSIPILTVPNEEPPPDIIEASPAKPELTTLVLSTKDDMPIVTLPDALETKWKESAYYTELLEYVSDHISNTTAKTNLKREPACDTVDGSPGKKPNIK